MRLTKKLLALFMCIALLASAATACATASASTNESRTLAVTDSNDAPPVSAKVPKYVFLFIGDGMSTVQINAAQVFRGNNKSGEIALGKLNFTQFPVAGIATTQDSTSFCPDSASTATSLSSGYKTHSGVIGLTQDKSSAPESITEKMKKAGYKIGIVSSVSLDHATPAAFYSHIDSRSKYYDIALQLAKSEFDYFGGGALLKPDGNDNDKKNVYEVIEENGYKIVNTRDEIMSLNSDSGKVYAISPVLQDSQALPYEIDRTQDSVSLSEFVKKGIDVLDNENGFFMMCESGKIDWACHANDARSAIDDVVSLANAVDEAMEFARNHPDETLILVTGDHETGGMTIGYATTGYDTAFDILSRQRISYVAFDEMIKDMKANSPDLTMDDVMPVIKENFGLMAPDDADGQKDENKALVMTKYEYDKLAKSFEESMIEEDKRANDQESSVLYGTYDPLSVTLTHILNNKAGVGWTSYAHTGVPVAVYAMGAGEELFTGSYDNTDVFNKLVDALNLE